MQEEIKDLDVLGSPPHTPMVRQCRVQGGDIFPSPSPSPSPITETVGAGLDSSALSSHQPQSPVQCLLTEMETELMPRDEEHALLRQKVARSSPREHALEDERRGRERKALRKMEVHLLHSTQP